MFGTRGTMSYIMELLFTIIENSMIVWFLGKIFEKKVGEDSYIRGSGAEKLFWSMTSLLIVCFVAICFSSSLGMLVGDITAYSTGTVNAIRFAGLMITKVCCLLIFLLCQRLGERKAEILEASYFIEKYGKMKPEKKNADLQILK